MATRPKLVAKTKIENGKRVPVSSPAPTPSTPTASPATPAKNNYQYIDTTGTTRTFEASSSDEAIKNAPGIGKNSGVMALGAGDTSGITATSGTSRDEEESLGKDIVSYSAPDYNTPSKNTKYLDDFEKTLMGIAGSEYDSINKRFDELRSKTEGEQAGESGQTSSMLARVGGYLGESGSGTGVMLSLAKSHRSELAELESKRQQAMFEARKFYANKQFELAKAKVDEAKDVEKTIYERQQDFFNNQRLVSQDERTILNQERDDARAVLTNLISNANGQSYDELDEETQKVIESSATKAGYPLGVIKSMLEKPKAEMARIDSLLKDAARKGAPGSILEAIASAESFTEAAKIAAPYLAKTGTGDGSGSGSGGGITTKFVPSSLSGIVASQGTNATLEDLLSPTAPSWFYPVASEVATSNFAELGLAGPVADPDPNGWIVEKVWGTFRQRAEIQLFIQEMRKKIIGTATDPNAKGGYGYDAGVTPDASTDVTE